MGVARTAFATAVPLAGPLSTSRSCSSSSQQTAVVGGEKVVGGRRDDAQGRETRRTWRSVLGQRGVAAALLLSIFAGKTLLFAISVIASHSAQLRIYMVDLKRSRYVSKTKLAVHTRLQHLLASQNPLHYAGSWDELSILAICLPGSYMRFYGMPLIASERMSIRGGNTRSQRWLCLAPPPCIDLSSFDVDHLNIRPRCTLPCL
jgi:hypothetical protein